MDSLSQGMQQSGGYKKLARPSNYTQVGQTRVEAPLRVSLDRLYGGQQSPQAPQMPSYGAPPAQTWSEPQVSQSGTDADLEAYLSGKGYDKETGHVTGWDTYRPADPTHGQAYQDSGGTMLLWNQNTGQWEGMEDSEFWQFASGADQSQMKSFTAGLTNMDKLIGENNQRISNLQMAIQNLESQDQGKTRNRNEIETYKQGIKKFQQENAEYNQMKEQLNQEIAGLEKSVEDRIRGGAEEYLETAPTAQTWQENLTGLLDNLDRDEFMDDDGEFDIEALRASDNVMADWVADILEDSSLTGMVAGDFMDEAGNLAPELQSLQDFFNNNPDMAAEQQRFSRSLAHNALQSGRSLNSGFYSDFVAGEVARVNAEVAEYTSGVIMKEIQGQYSYIANSFAQTLREAGRATEADMIQSQLSLAYTEMEQAFDQHSQDLSQRIAEQEAARRGQIFTGIITTLINLIPGL